MGDMTVEIAPNLPAPADESLLNFQKSPDSCFVGKVLRDGFIQFENNAQLPDARPTASAQAPVSGTLVLSGGKFYLVQGRTHTDATLDKWEQSSGQKLSPDAREQYKKQGGALPLEGRGMVVGRLARGREVLDRIAALPSDSKGKPLVNVPVRVTISQ